MSNGPESRPPEFTKVINIFPLSNRATAQAMNRFLPPDSQAFQLYDYKDSLEKVSPNLVPVVDRLLAGNPFFQQPTKFDQAEYMRGFLTFYDAAQYSLRDTETVLPDMDQVHVRELIKNDVRQGAMDSAELMRSLDSGGLLGKVDELTTARRKGTEKRALRFANTEATFIAGFKLNAKANGRAQASPEAIASQVFGAADAKGLLETALRSRVY